MAELMKHPPEQYKKRAKALAEEGKDIANKCLKSALDAADTAARQLVTGTILRCHAWLRTRCKPT